MRVCFKFLYTLICVFVSKQRPFVESFRENVNDWIRLGCSYQKRILFCFPFKHNLVEFVRWTWQDALRNTMSIRETEKITFLFCCMCKMQRKIKRKWNKTKLKEKININKKIWKKIKKKKRKSKVIIRK